MAGDWNPETGVVDEFLDRLPTEVLESFTPEQRAALWQNARPATWRRHPIDIRISLPLLGGRLFFTVVAGLERRTRSRRRRDSRTHPFFTAGNLFFLFVLFIVAVALGTVLTDVVDSVLNSLGLSEPVAHGTVKPH